jgi:DNA-binding response OmpR family regulator
MEPADTAQTVVLVVEDDEVIRELLKVLLEQAGHIVMTAADGAVGIALIEAGDVDVVVLDLMLPEVDGLDVCRRARALEQPIYLPIVMLTALADQTQRHAGFRAGADDYVTKPFNPADVVDRVQVWARVRQRLTAAHAQQLRQQALERELAEAALRERLAQDEAVLAMARTASDQLNQPLAVLLGTMELRRAGRYPANRAERLWDELEQATKDLAERVAALTRVVRYEPIESAGLPMLDLTRAQDADR